jgi:sterol desaturase/sphingolipid hydroxylase (fatty acid hydroxylase superfamily)
VEWRDNLRIFCQGHLMLAAAVQLGILMAVFTVLEGWWPSSRAHKWWRRPLMVDLCSWAVHPISVSAGIALAVTFTKTLTNGFTHSRLWPMLSAMRIQVAAFPLLAQMAIAVVAADFLAYWMHRAYHRFSFLWAFHVVHHTSRELDWLSTSRLHPVSQMLNTAVVGTILLFAGLPVTAVVVANVVIGAAALLVHANVNWTFGPFKHLVVSPLFHQWHHARLDGDDHDHGVGNFGAIFSVWDRLFGTWSVPAANRPARFGVENAPSPTLTGLILHPLHVGIHFLSNIPGLRGLLATGRAQMRRSRAENVKRQTPQKRPGTDSPVALKTMQ